LCPSCGAKQAAELAAFLVDEVAEDVGHAQWVFTIPKMLRVYFLYHGELLGELSRAAAQTARQLLTAAAGEEEASRPGIVSVGVLEPSEGPAPQGRASAPRERPGRGRGVSTLSARAGGPEASLGSSSVGAFSGVRLTSPKAGPSAHCDNPDLPCVVGFERLDRLVVGAEQFISGSWRVHPLTVASTSEGS
jgi:hypothetical protein